MNKMNRVLGIVLVCVLTVIMSVGCAQKDQGSEGEAAASQSEFPSKPINIIVPYSAGGSTDMVGRNFSSVMSKYLPNGEAVVIVNKPGGSGAVGLTELFTSNPDGYTLALTTSGITSIGPNYGNANFTHDSFQTIMQITSSPQVLFVKADAPWKTFDEWKDYVTANPGQFSYGTGGAAPRIAMETLMDAVGLEAKFVPFEGAGPTVAAVLGGHVDGAVLQTQEVKSQLEDGSIRALVNLGSEKNDAVKDLPLLKEIGIDVGQNIYTGLVAPKGTPDEVVAVLHDAFKAALEDPELDSQFETMGATVSYAGPEDFQEIISTDYEVSGKIMKKIGLIE